MILEILLPVPTNKTFFYKIKDEFRNIKVGTIVKVEFRNQISFGIIWKKCPDSSFSKPIKEIISIFENLCLPNEVIKSIDFISKYSCLSKSMVLKKPTNDQTGMKSGIENSSASSMDWLKRASISVKAAPTPVEAEEGRTGLRRKRKRAIGEGRGERRRKSRSKR